MKCENFCPIFQCTPATKLNLVQSLSTPLTLQIKVKKKP